MLTKNESMTERKSILFFSEQKLIDEDNLIFPPEITYGRYIKIRNSATCRNVDIRQAEHFYEDINKIICD